MGNAEAKRSKSFDKKTKINEKIRTSFKTKKTTQPNDQINLTQNLNAISSFSESFKANVLKSKITPFEDDYIYMNKELGHGINGKVILVINKLDKKKYALKKIVDSRHARREVSLQWRSSIDCPHIVKIKDIYENRIGKTKYLFVVMEYMEGGELFDKIKKRNKIHFTEQEIAKIMLQICKAVHHLHSLGIAHRDLKPENILLASKEDDSLIKLSDFGFAKEANEGLITPNYTPYYVPPEILRFQKYDISCDIWSLGVIMYILCCGYPPFYSTQGKRISPGMEKRIKRGQYDFPDTEWSVISDDAKGLIDGMLETVPEQRLTIDKIMKSKWLTNFIHAPTTRLNSIKIMNNNPKTWKVNIDDMDKALNEMRINYEQEIKLKNMTEINNPLFKKRLNKTENTNKKLKKNDENENIKNNENITNNNNVVTLAPKADLEDRISNSSKKSQKINELKLKRQYSTPVIKSPLTALYYSINLHEN